MITKVNMDPITQQNSVCDIWEVLCLLTKNDAVGITNTPELI